MAKIRLDRHADGVRLLTLDDHAHRNAIDSAMRDELSSAVARLAADTAARAVVVTGAGSAFCAGANLPELFGAAASTATGLRIELMRVYASFLAVRDLPVPVIAAVNGPAVGAGVNLALACGIRYLAPGAFLDISFVRLGIHPGGGATAFLTEALGASRALELILRGARIEAGQALEAGLANAVVDDPLAYALEFAAQLAAQDPELIRDIVATARTAATGNLGAVVTAEAVAQAASLLRNPAVLASRESRQRSQ